MKCFNDSSKDSGERGDKNAISLGSISQLVPEI